MGALYSSVSSGGPRTQAADGMAITKKRDDRSPRSALQGHANEGGEAVADHGVTLPRLSTR